VKGLRRRTRYLALQRTQFSKSISMGFVICGIVIASFAMLAHHGEEPRLLRRQKGAGCGEERRSR
jgi:hypothetical protein